MSSELPTLVLLPGLDGTSLLFKPLLKELDYDGPIHKVNYPANKNLSLRELVNYVSRKLIEIGPVVLLAESFSGLVAIRLKREHPQKIKGIIFCATFHTAPRPILMQIARWLPLHLIPLHKVPEFFLKQYCLGKQASKQEVDLLRTVLNQVPSKILLDRLYQIPISKLILQSIPTRLFTAMPACYIQASEDKLVPEKAVDWFKNNFDMCEVHTIKGPHFILQTKPKECSNIIQRFIEKHKSSFK